MTDTPINTSALDIIGTLYDQPTTEGGPATALPGWHVNAPWPVAGWDAWRVTPATPRRVFAGAATVCYTFADEAEFLAALETADLSPPVPVPGSVTMRQARLALLGAGKLAQVDAAINAMPEPMRSAALIEWQYSNEVQRHNGFVAALGPALGMTEAQIDQLFRAAAAL